MTARQHRIAWASVAAILLLVVVAFFSLRSRLPASQDPALQQSWRNQNTADLLQLSAVKAFSNAEQRRLNLVAGDPERLRQALIELHEDRLANVSKDLTDAQKRQHDLRSNVSGSLHQQKDQADLANEDERTATAQIALYAGALSRIRAWRPTSYPDYVASLHTSPRSPQPTGTSPMPPAAAPQSPRPDPVDLQADIQYSMRHPAVTVYADAAKNEPAPDLPPAAAPAPVAAAQPDAPAPADTAPDLSTRERNEREVRQTLHRWAASMTSNDPPAEVAEYAPHMQRYFLRKDVDIAFVLADKIAYRERGYQTITFDVEDISFENETTNSTDVRLTKDVTWQRNAVGQTHTLIRSWLHLERLGNSWKITGERDFH